jgi:hypothetical protein
LVHSYFPIDLLIFKETTKSIRDPEHPYTIEQLDVINLKDIQVIGNYYGVYPFIQQK